MTTSDKTITYFVTPKVWQANEEASTFELAVVVVVVIVVIVVTDFAAIKSSSIT